MGVNQLADGELFPQSYPLYLRVGFYSEVLPVETTADYYPIVGWQKVMGKGIIPVISNNFQLEQVNVEDFEAFFNVKVGWVMSSVELVGRDEA
jgi:hypothetical protein